MNVKAKRFTRIKHWISTHKKSTVLIVLALIIVGVGGSWLVYNNLNQKPDEPPRTAEKPKAEKPPEKYYSKLSGAQVGSEEAANSPVVSVMIENSPNARPQSGLQEAGVVFEAVAEAGITRFLALYQNESPELIGPVRSVREYYIDWAGGFDASLAHVGGSYQALQRMRDGKHKDIDQFFNAGTFWRATDKYAPHNVYTNFKNLTAIHQANNWNSSNFQAFERKDKALEGEEYTPATNININFSSATYNTSYSYNSETKSYNRSMAGAPHLDREKDQISPKNIIAMKVDMWLDTDGYHNQIKTLGQGEAIFFIDGKVINGSWNKDSETSPLIFKDSSGKSIKFNRGQTWISAVPNQSGGVSWE
ncbi:MAG: DUF3048 domain-containing protein [Candidatus Sacchiramonaceae bacterium]|nr:DUF3048 domain-containing protein [Candidatus Saccharimonadaceae bacterium]